MTKTLGLIGSGMIGGAVARLAVAAGLDVVLSNSRGPDTLAGLVGELGARAWAATPDEAARAGDLVVAAIPMHAYDRLPAAALAGKTVIDTANYYAQRDGRIAELDTGRMTSSALVQRHLADSYVVKAFNNTSCGHLSTRVARPSGAPDRSALPLAGDAAAKSQVVRLMDALGYDGVDIGTLADSWRMGHGSPVYVQPYIAPQPQGLRPGEADRWFFEDPGVPVSANRVKALAATAVRRFQTH